MYHVAGVEQNVLHSKPEQRAALTQLLHLSLLLLVLLQTWHSHRRLIQQSQDKRHSRIHSQASGLELEFIVSVLQTPVWAARVCSRPAK
jgi:hypothetical protein